MTRNFRRTYYKSLGVPVHSFAELLGEDTQTPSLTINLSQLVRMVVEFGLPAVYRVQVWCIVSQVVPLVRDAEADTWEYVRRERSQIFDDVAMAADVCMPLSPTTKTSRLLHLHKFYIDYVRPNLHSSLSSDEAKGNTWVSKDVRLIESLATAIQEVLEEPADQFWCLLTFLDHIDRGFKLLQPPVSLEEMYDVSPVALENVIFRILAGGSAHPSTGECKN
ncbi:hypothetical protein AC1031_007457 [Aphanomyces cochlioides]|nr:hypothetical protein AC1031_007457 [Aphanomyces cochlioides]